jgi:sigma-54 dependent transcriptional regulator, acetoin dehydrogenase operon transcriptional activator AcoR
MEINLPHKEILNCMSEAVYVIDCDMNIRYSNPAAHELTGHIADIALGKKCREIFCEASSRCLNSCPPKLVLKNLCSLESFIPTIPKA